MRAKALELFRRMLLIRRFEDLVQSLFLEGAGPRDHAPVLRAGGVTGRRLLGAGRRDRVAGTYRGHGVALALGVEPQALLDELLGKATGVCAGRAGSMNVVDLKHRLIGCFGIVGGSIGAATGAALALRERGGVAVAFFGDGATNQGYFHECLNFAKVMALPVVYVCENNLYGEFTPWQAGHRGRDPLPARDARDRVGDDRRQRCLDGAGDGAPRSRVGRAPATDRSSSRR